MARIVGMNFNPRSREGSDTGISIEHEGGIPISIHAPVKGATHQKSDNAWGQDISIHAPVKGATVYMSFHGRGIQYFNPRSREGSDYQMVLCG